MNNVIGIRHEDKYVMERRVPLIPRHVAELIGKQKMNIMVQQSPKRVFTDQEFKDAGANVVDHLYDAPVIFGVKEIPINYFEADKTYVFFSHVIKGQAYNMPMLKRMMELKCNLIDYEKIVDEAGRRLIFFGRFAGLAGMINSLWSLGKRWKHLGVSTPFEKINQSHTYHSLEDAKRVISEVGFEIARHGLPEVIKPLVIGITGYGNVSNGAQEIASLLPIKEISPAELLERQPALSASNNVIYKVVFKEENLSRPKKSGVAFDLADYYAHPANYEDQFQQYIPYLTVLMNCMYWDERYPRIITKDYLEKLYAQGNPKLTVIGDVTCDPDGSVECTYKGTEIEDPVFVYNPFTREHHMGFEGVGILDMAVDILPSELPRESSIAFSEALFQYIKGIAVADYQVPFKLLNLPNPVKRALILHRGELTPDYTYIAKYL